MKEGGIVAESTIVSMEYLGKTSEGEKFAGKKVGDKVVFNPAAAGNGSDAEVASMLNIDKEQAAGVKSNFEFTIKEIIVLKPAEKIRSSSTWCLARTKSRTKRNMQQS